MEWLLHGEGPLQRLRGIHGRCPPLFARVRHGTALEATGVRWSNWSFLISRQPRASDPLQPRVSGSAALTAAVIQSALRFEPVSSDEVIARLPAARIRIRAVPLAPRWSTSKSRRSMVAPAARFDATLCRFSALTRSG